MANTNDPNRKDQPETDPSRRAPQTPSNPVTPQRAPNVAPQPEGAPFPSRRSGEEDTEPTSKTPLNEQQTGAAQEQTIEEHSRKLGTPASVFEAAKVYHGWGAQKRLTREQYEEAIKTVQGVKLR